MLVVAILGILSAITYGVSRAAFRNASLGSTTFELSARLLGLKATAIAEQTDHLFVVIDAPDAAACSWTAPAKCGRYFVLRNPSSTFTLATFDPSAPGALAEYVDSDYLPAGVRFHPNPPGAPPPPFAGVPMFSSELTVTSAPRRFAIRFVRDGTVTGEKAGSATGPWAGYAFALTTTQLDETRAADRKGIVVAFPAGIVRTFSVQ
jgi:hypothetical protein